MNEEAYKVHFESLSDFKLNESIKDLSELKRESRNLKFDKLGHMACHEWTRRYPGTIAPFLYESAMAKGGFPSCYSGPTETITISKE